MSHDAKLGSIQGTERNVPAKMTMTVKNKFEKQKAKKEAGLVEELKNVVKSVASEDKTYRHPLDLSNENITLKSQEGGEVFSEIDKINLHRTGQLSSETIRITLKPSEPAAEEKPLRKRKIEKKKKSIVIPPPQNLVERAKVRKTWAVGEPMDS